MEELNRVYEENKQIKLFMKQQESQVKSQLKVIEQLRSQSEKAHYSGKMGTSSQSLSKVPKLDLTRLGGMQQEENGGEVPYSDEGFLSKSMLNAAELIAESLGTGSDGEMIDPEEEEGEDGYYE